MGFDKVKLKQIRRLVLFVAAVVLALMYSGALFRGIAIGFRIISPFLVGGVIAFVLNIPLTGLERKLFHKSKSKRLENARRPVGILLSILIVVAVLGLVILAVVPQLAKTVAVLGEKLPDFVDNMFAQLEQLTKDYPVVAEKIEELDKVEIDWDTLYDTVGGFLRNGLSSMLVSTVNVASNIVGGIVNFFISFVFALYILSQKEKLADQGRRILRAYLPYRVNRAVLEVLFRLYNNFRSFVCGQCLEAVILGTMFVITMAIFRMPFAVMIGTLIAFTALIPIVGAFIGCFIGAFMILIENPVQAVWFVVLFLVLQQIEGNLIYPKVVGNSVGLPSIWVLMAVSVGGSLFGIAGMLFFIPLLSTIYSLLRDDVNRRNAKGRQERRKPYHHQQYKGEKVRHDIPKE